MHDLVASPFLGKFLVLRPGYANGIKIPAERYRELAQAGAVPAWLTEISRKAWDADPGTLLIRPESALGYGRATYELNLGCNYDCEQSDARGRHDRWCSLPV